MEILLRTTTSVRIESANELAVVNQAYIIDKNDLNVLQVHAFAYRSDTYTREHHSTNKFRDMCARAFRIFGAIFFKFKHKVDIF